ncbi:MAG: sulfurtransferase [Magnetococcales bacterium]|nr:sulfurtransferase [Magnetococcales bacterium]
MTSIAEAEPLPGLFVDAEWLTQHLKDRDLRIVQVGGENYYSQNHIPGAVLVRLQELTVTVDKIPGMRPSRTALVGLFGRLGIGPKTQVVAYDSSGGMDAARLVWTLATLGHTGAAVLDGGMVLWYQGGRPVTHVAPRIPPASFKAKTDDRWEITGKAVLELSEKGDDAAGPILLDTRSDGEYLGKVLRGPRGHIPGARHMDWLDALADRNQPLLKDRTQIQRRLVDAGITDPQRPVVVYCQTAHRASHTWVLLRHLGYQDVRLYDGSIAEWDVRGWPLVSGAGLR